MTYHPDRDKRQNELPSLDDFLTPASGSSNYQFDQNIARVFHSLLLSSLYAYLCLMEQLLQSTKTAKEEQIRRNVGSFSNAVRILYFVSHSNAMKAYFTLVGLPLLYPAYRDSGYYKNQLRYAIHTKLNLPIMLEAYDYGDRDSDPQENYVEDFKENNALSIYRRSFMSFVDYYASLRILERRCSRLPADTTIKLSLFAVRHPKIYYFPWEEMEKVILKTCQDFRSTTTSNPVEGQDMINKIKGHLDRSEGSRTSDKVIDSFKTLLMMHRYEQILNLQPYPLFPASIHCEAFLAAILCQLLDSVNNLELHKLFQACPSSHTSSFIP